MEEIEVVVINYGLFINVFILFVIIMFVVFMLIKVYNLVKVKFEEEEKVVFVELFK